MSKIVLITGCSSGVGMQTALLLAQEGHKVFATMRNPDKGGALTKMAQEKGLALSVLRLDVQDEDTINSCMGHILKKEGGIDILVNNAGFGFLRSLEQASMEEVYNVMDVNFYGVIRCIKAVLPQMRKQRSGQIVTVSSVGGLVGQPMNEIYCAAKFALEGLVESMATYMEPYFNIKMTLIEPAGIKTEFVNRVLSDIHHTGGILKDDYAKVINDYMSTSQKRGSFDKTAQTPEQVAQVIAGALKQEETTLRIQTSEAAKAFTRIKLGDDPTGNNLQKEVRTNLLGK